MGSGEPFELGVDAAFSAVGGGFDPLWLKDCCWRVEVDKQHLGPPKMVEAVVGLAHVVVCPHAGPCTGFGVFDQGLLVHPRPVDGGEFVQLRTPLRCLVQRGDPGQLQREFVDGAPGIRARVAGGVAAHHALGVDQAALDFRVRPALFDRAVGALAAVDDGDEWGFDAFKQELVVAGGFVFAPVSGDHVVDCRRDDQTAAGGVGAVEEDLVVNPFVVACGGVRHINEPERFESTLHRARRAPHAAGNSIEAGAGGEVVDEGGERRRVGDVASAFHAGGAALFAPPSGGAFAGGAVAFHFTAAVAAWLVL